MTGQITFILWRETIEALLIIGILWNWLVREGAGRRAAAYLWGGIGAGIGVAVIFALAVMGVASLMPAAAQQYLMTGMVFLAAGLIVHMVFWMRAHGRTLKRDLETGLHAAAEQRHWWTLFVLAMVAVAREGSETVVFLYGTLAAAQGAVLYSVLGAVAAGLGAAILTYGLLQLGGRFLPWRVFFKVSEVLLLLLGAALFVTGAGDLVSAGVLPFTPILWDTSWLLDDGGRLGGVIAALTGYRAAPDTVTMLAWLAYWGFIALAFRHEARRATARRLTEARQG